MTTSKGTIQGYNGVATVDKQHQVIISADAFGSGQETHTLPPVLETVKDRFRRLGISDDIYADGAHVTADTGFASDDNYQYLIDQKISATIPDNQFRSRDPRFRDQKKKHPRKSRAKKDRIKLYPAEDFIFDEDSMSCLCPNGQQLSFYGIHEAKNGVKTARFEGRLSQCRDCAGRRDCMENPDAANHRKGHGRVVSFRLKQEQEPTASDLMKTHVDSNEGKRLYSHRMSVAEPPFGNLEHNKGLRRFSLRGREKVDSQWKLFCLVHNIEKLANYSRMAA